MSALSSHLIITSVYRSTIELHIQYLTIIDIISYYDFMSSRSSSDKRMNNSEVTKIVREMLKKSTSCLIIRQHCLDRMRQRQINQRDVINVLLGGTCRAAEQHIKSGFWVYRFETNNYRVECNVFKHKSIVAITAIRKRKGG